MVDKIGDFIYGFFFVVSLGGDDDLCRFFPDFFEDLVYTFFKEIGCVRAFFFLRPAPFDELHQTFRGKTRVFRIQIYQVVETGVRAEVTGRAVFGNGHYQRVSVAVGDDAVDVLVIAGSFAFKPQFLTGTAPEAGKTLFHGDPESCFIRTRPISCIFQISASKTI